MSSTTSDTATGITQVTQSTTTTLLDSVTTASTFTDTTARNVTVTLVLGILFCATLGLNICFVTLYAMVRRFRIPPNYLLVSIAAADILSAIFWILPSMVTSATWAWLLGQGFCQFEGVISTLFYSLNVTTLLALMMERFMKFWSPSSHKDTFTKKVTLILVFSLWLFSVVFGIMPVIGWGEVAYISPRFDCVMNFGASYSLLHFFTITAYLIPLLLMLVFFGLIVGKLRHSQKRPNAMGDVVLEERRDRPSESYAEKLKRREEQFKDIANKRSKPRLGKSRKNCPVEMNPADDGYGSAHDDKGAREAPELLDDFDSEESDFDWNNSDEEEYYLDYMDAINQRREAERRARTKRRFRLHQREVSMFYTLSITACVFMVLWSPIMVLNYLWVYNHYPKYQSEAIHTAFMVLAVASVAYKPLVYIGNGYMRNTTKKALHKRRMKRRLQRERDEMYDERVGDTRQDVRSRGRSRGKEQSEGLLAETRA